jgi:transposase-like protein
MMARQRHRRLVIDQREHAGTLVRHGARTERLSGPSFLLSTSPPNAVILLMEQGLANQTDVARAFGCSTRTVRRQQRRFEDGGLAALGRSPGYPRGRARVAGLGRQLVHNLNLQGHSYREIARRIGVSEKAIRNLVRSH